ncbi:hypothetical protein LPJ59_005299, partial [Coemansia sp. RSA 2399]
MDTLQSVSDVHRKAFIQWCMSSQLFTEQSLNEAIARIYTEETAAAIELQAEVEQMNGTLSVLSLQLRSAMDQRSGSRLWAL